MKREYDEWHQELVISKGKSESWKKDPKNISTRNEDGGYMFYINPFGRPKLHFQELGKQEERFTLWFYHQDISSTGPKSTKWFQACKKDSEIRSHLIEKLEYFIKGNQAQNKKLEQNLQILLEI